MFTTRFIQGPSRAESTKDRNNEKTKSVPSSAPVIGSGRGSEFEQGRETHLQVSVPLSVLFPAKER